MFNVMGSSTRASLMLSSVLNDRENCQHELTSSSPIPASASNAFKKKKLDKIIKETASTAKLYTTFKERSIYTVFELLQKSCAHY
jgi:hypothetical protein